MSTLPRLSLASAAPGLIPRKGFTARLVILASAVTGFLAVLLLGLSLTADAVATSWQDKLTQSATVRLPAATSETDIALLLDILRQTDGVQSSQVLSRAETVALLEPWLSGGDFPAGLSLPRLVTVTGTPDLAGLRLRLQGELPGAVLDDHGAWRKPVVAAAGRVQLLALAGASAVALATCAIIALAAQAALAANAQVVAVLRTVGARDGAIVMLFVRRFTNRTFAGAAVGSGVAAAALAAMSVAPGPLPILGGSMGFQGSGWLLPVLVPIASAIIAGLTTAAAARVVLRET